MGGLHDRLIRVACAYIRNADTTDERNSPHGFYIRRRLQPLPKPHGHGNFSDWGHQLCSVYLQSLNVQPFRVQEFKTTHGPCLHECPGRTLLVQSLCDFTTGNFSYQLGGVVAEKCRSVSKIKIQLSTTQIV